MKFASLGDAIGWLQTPHNMVGIGSPLPSGSITSRKAQMRRRRWDSLTLRMERGWQCRDALEVGLDDLLKLDTVEPHILRVRPCVISQIAQGRARIGFWRRASGQRAMPPALLPGGHLHLQLARR